MRRKNSEQGFVLITTLLLMGLMLAFLAVYYTTTAIETATVRHSKSSASGFYASEAGLNLRAENIRSIFVGYNRPTGASPVTTAPCTAGDNGSGDFACQNITINNRTVRTFVLEDPGNPIVLTIPPGERYQNLNAQEYRYTAQSVARNNQGRDEADLRLRFKSRLVPLFQFAAFYNKDLEILPGPTMSLAGPVHTNGDLYLYSNSASLNISGQVTVASDLYRGRKDGSVSPSCNNRPVNIIDPLNLRTLIPSCSSRYKVTSTDIVPWNNMIQINVQPVTVPAPDVFTAEPGAIYWDKADLRLVFELDGSENPVGYQVRNADDSIDAGASTQLNACAGNLGGRVVNTLSINPASPPVFRNWRENKYIRMLDVDVQSLLNCLHSTNWFGTGKSLNDSTEGGLVFHFTIKGPSSGSGSNNYGIRLRNAARLQSTIGGAPTVRGMTVVSDQAVYVQGDYNAQNKIPAAVMADSLNVLSNAWNDSNSTQSLSNRVASSTTINSAFLSGTDVTGSNEGETGQGGAYNGGLENYPRFHENWSGRTLLYRGSFVSLGTPLHVNGSWGSQSYSPPNRDWNYDTSFNNAANLPPITPRFVYLRQELFVRDFERDQ
ncbi:MAG: hypothetical protein J5J00_12455 [Deltaproteobacteria bacterium]|nr:hypothetical protein [Deltaproteobacteria bacterium]